MRNFNATIVLVVLCLLAAACGARLTEEQRELGISGGAGTGEVAPGGAAGAGGDAGEVAGGDTGASGPIDVSSDPGSGGGQGSQPGGGAAGGSTGGDQAAAQEGSAGQAGQQASGDGGTQDTRAAPPGGNGGQTDVGVTEDKIVIANGSDISGAVPGLFEDAQLAVAAYIRRFASTEGTVYGRQLDYLPLDTKLDEQGNRNAYIEACDRAFAAVGSMSAFEQGAIDPITQCGIPDLRTAAPHPRMQEVEQMYSMDAMSPQLQPLAEYNFWKEQIGEGVKRSGYLFIDAETTRYQTQLVRDGTKQIGYEWPYVQPVDIAETNYAPFVLEMKNKDIRFVTFQGAYQQAVRLAEAMRQQNYWPEVFALQSNAYTPAYIESGGQAVEGTHIAVPSVILEEIDQHPELQEYRRWLKQVAPDAEPTGLGMYAWSAAKLFVEKLKEVGPELTRQKMLQALSQVQGYDGGGLLPPQDVGSRRNADCVIIVEVRDGGFVRVEPAQGMRCDDHVVETDTQY